MLSLIVKDLFVVRWFLPVILVLYAAQLVTMTVSPPAAMIVTLVFTFLLAFGSLGVEESQGTEVTWCSLPVGRHQIVLARYATTLLAIALGLGISWAISGSILGPAAHATVFFFLTITASLFFPCYFRLGLGRGMATFAMVTLAALVLLAGAGALISFLTDGSPIPDMSDEQRLAEVDAWFQRMEPFLASGLVVLALALASASAALSVRWYSVRDC